MMGTITSLGIGTLAPVRYAKVNKHHLKKDAQANLEHPFKTAKYFFTFSVSSVVYPHLYIQNHWPQPMHDRFDYVSQ